MPLFFFGNNFYKNKETFKIFSPQLLEVYRILLVETTLESMFYYTFSVINTMFVPCTALLYDSTAATRTLKLSIEHGHCCGTLQGHFCGPPSINQQTERIYNQDLTNPENCMEIYNCGDNLNLALVLWLTLNSP